MELLIGILIGIGIGLLGILSNHFHGQAEEMRDRNETRQKTPRPEAPPPGHIVRRGGPD